MAAAPSHKQHEDFDSLPYPVVVMQSRWPSGASTRWHAHPKGQLLYATDGVMLVDSEAGSWVVPPNRALWIVAGLRHQVTMSGEVLMRTAYIDAHQITGLPGESCVVNVSPLLRELLVEAVRIPPSARLQGRDALLMELLTCELRGASTLALHLPVPCDPRLREVCRALSARPSDASSAADWARSIGVGERTLHRLFTLETGMTFARWREQARLLHALRRIAGGDRIIEVALDCGYSSPSAFSAMFRRHFGVAPSSFYR